jgi:hypothetical protein
MLARRGGAPRSARLGALAGALLLLLAAAAAPARAGGAPEEGDYLHFEAPDEAFEVRAPARQTRVGGEARLLAAQAPLPWQGAGKLGGLAQQGSVRDVIFGQTRPNRASPQHVWLAAARLGPSPRRAPNPCICPPCGRPRRRSRLRRRGT